MKKEVSFENASTAETISKKLLAPKVQKALLQDPKEYDRAILRGEAVIASARDAVLDAAFAYLQTEEFKALSPEIQKYQAKNLKTGFLIADQQLNEFQTEANAIMAKISGRLNQPEVNRVNAFVDDPTLDAAINEAEALRSFSMANAGPPVDTANNYESSLVDPAEAEAFARTKQ